MRVHVTVEDELVRELDARVGPGRRSAFLAALLRRALDDERRWDLIESSLGRIGEDGHEWDHDAALWVAEQRGSDPARLG